MRKKERERKVRGKFRRRPYITLYDAKVLYAYTRLRGVREEREDFSTLQWLLGVCIYIYVSPIFSGSLYRARGTRGDEEVEKAYRARARVSVSRTTCSELLINVIDRTRTLRVAALEMR